MSYFQSEQTASDIVGQVIDSVTVSDDRQTLRIDFADGTAALGEVFGDCCSRTWIEHLTVPSDIKGATVTALKTAGWESRELAEGEGPGEHAPEWTDVVKVYQDSVETTRGAVVIEYRNDSNGYYGGDISWSFAR